MVHVGCVLTLFPTGLLPGLLSVGSCPAYQIKHRNLFLAQTKSESETRLSAASSTSRQTTFNGGTCLGF